MDCGAGKDLVESSSSDSSFTHATDDEYDVDYILGKRIRYGGVSMFIPGACMSWARFVIANERRRKTLLFFHRMQVEYCIKWKNYPENECTWEPEANLSCSQLLEEYEKLHADCEDLLVWYPQPIKVLKKVKVRQTMMKQQTFSFNHIREFSLKIACCKCHLID